MNSLQSWAVVHGLVIVLGLQSATPINDSSVEIEYLSNATSIFTWVTAVVMGAQIIAVVVFLIRAAYLRRKEGPKRRRA